MIKKITLTLSTLALLLVPVAAPALVSAQGIGSIGQGLNPASPATQQINTGLCAGTELDVKKINTGCNPTDNQAAAETKVNDIIKLVINIFSLVVGVVSVIMIILGGLKYITSGGESGNVSGAKNTILYAIVGLVVVALAQVIVKFVLGKATQ